MKPAAGQDRLSCTVGSADAGERLDNYLTRTLKAMAFPGEVSRSKVSQWIEAGQVLIDSAVASKPGVRLKGGSQIELEIPPPEPNWIAADAAVPFEIVYEDDAILIIDKPAGVVVHPGAGQREKTLVHGLVHHLGDKLQPIGDTLRPGIVHRLDKDTSGLMVIAKSEVAYQSLLKQFTPPRSIVREYVALSTAVPGSVRGAESGVIALPIGRHPTQRTKMSVKAKSSKEASTSWVLLDAFRYGVLLGLKLDTGRTHQIRVHLQAAGAPIVGDTVYGTTMDNLPSELQRSVRAFGRQALHAAKLSFVHPLSGRVCSFESAPPAAMSALIEAFRKAK